MHIFHTPLTNKLPKKIGTVRDTIQDFILFNSEAALKRIFDAYENNKINLSDDDYKFLKSVPFEKSGRTCNGVSVIKKIPIEMPEFITWQPFCSIEKDRDIKNNYVQDLNERLKMIIQSSIAHQAKKIDARKTDQSNRSLNIPATNFVPGTYVLVEYNQPKIVIKPTKLHPYWQGPWIVLEAKGNLIICKNIVTQYVQEFHRSQLKRYLEGGEMTPYTAALKDLNEIPVETILDHRYKTNPVTGRILLKTLEFLVKWTGHPHEDSTWTKYAQLRDAQAVDIYIRDKPEFRQISNVPV
jgi:hypothetical protein